MIAREVLRHLIRRAGYDVFRSYRVRRGRLLDHLGIETVLDIGANAGQYARDIRAEGYAGRLVSFEPQSGAYAKLSASSVNDPLWETRPLALGDSDGETQIRVAMNDAWSSLLPRDAKTRASQLGYVATETVTTARLDSLDVLDGSPTWLKIDVQGFEMRVLWGATEALRHVVAVECEVALEPLYVGQPSPRDIVDFLDDRGFSLAVVDTGEFRESGRTVWIDGIFVRSRHGS